MGRPVEEALQQSETAPVYGYLKRPSMVDFPGILAAVMFTSGCNFTCGYCHNAALMRTRRDGITWEKLKEGCDRFRDQWVKGVSITGGEPTLWGDELVRLVRVLKRQGFKVKVDTNGSRPDVVAKLAGIADFVAMDVKCSPAKYGEFVNFHHPERIAESVDIIRASFPAHEFRTTIVEDFHTDEQMAEIKKLVAGAKRYALQPFIPRDDLPDESFRVRFRTRASRMEELLDFMAGCADSVELRGN
ncbi:MAG: anaerobic ribonucleoside-triphosphate reductase activating protein [Lentisphaeria bacterium]|nr:anaerobic ribonucleoside-triphosphate reductase activating protein [Lentisphaeria bacterium]